MQCQTTINLKLMQLVRPSSAICKYSLKEPEAKSVPASQPPYFIFGIMPVGMPRNLDFDASGQTIETVVGISPLSVPQHEIQLLPVSQSPYLYFVKEGIINSRIWRHWATLVIEQAVFRKYENRYGTQPEICLVAYLRFGGRHIYFRYESMSDVAGNYHHWCASPRKYGRGVWNFVYSMLRSIEERKRRKHLWYSKRHRGFVVEDLGLGLLPLNTAICSPAIFKKSPKRILLSFFIRELWWQKWRVGNFTLPRLTLSLDG